ncbi:hypothetical protein CG719_29140 [Streptomyces sp. CB01373]|nr:hypothetical protein CG719_29140 [Streptomyces sp. CB01373]
MHAAGLYRQLLPHFTNPRNRAVSPLNMQGTPNVKDGERVRGGNEGGASGAKQGQAGRGKERRDAEASLATLATERLTTAQPLCRCAMQ